MVPCMARAIGCLSTHSASISVNVSRHKLSIVDTGSVDQIWPGALLTLMVHADDLHRVNKQFEVIKVSKSQPVMWPDHRANFVSLKDFLYRFFYLCLLAF